MSIIPFLNQVLPQSGVKAWLALKDNVPRQGFVSTIPQLVEVLQGLDQQGYETYFGCAGYNDRSGRRASAVCAVRSFWIDVDVGDEPTKYPTVAAAQEGTAQFCAKLNLPTPTIVCSGGGIHVWWSLTRDIDPREWLIKAKHLKEAAFATGFRIGRERVGDIASVLRPPGTLNRKYGSPRQVYLLNELQPPLSDFVIGSTPPLSGTMPDFVGGISQTPDMAKGFPDGQRTDEMMRRIGWLLGPRGMTYEDALQALRLWNTLNQPPLPDDKLMHSLRSIYVKEQQRVKHETMTIWGDKGAPSLPTGYRWGPEHKLQHAKEDDLGVVTWQTIVEYPVYLDRMIRNETNNEISVRIQHLHPNEGWRKFLLPAADLEGQAWKQHLAKMGVIVYTHGARAFKNYLEHVQNDLRRTMKDQVQYDQFGPRENFTEFVYGNRVYRVNGTDEEIEVTPHLKHRADKMGPQKGADIASWTDAADSLFATGCEAQGLTLLAGFAAPLIHMVCGNEGGAILSLTSPGSGRGKSTALEAAASIWGHMHATQISDIDTQNSAMKQYSILGYLPIICDEKANKAKDSGYIIEQKRAYTNGREKGRLDQKGNPRDLPKAFHTIMIEASNRPFIELAMEANDEAMMARVLELTVSLPEHLQKARIDKWLQKTLDKNAGVAGEIYIKYILRPEVMAWLQKAVPSACEKIKERINMGNEYRFIYWLIGCCVVAGAITKQLGLLHFDLDKIMNYACKQVEERKVDTMEMGKAEVILPQIIASNINDMLIVDHAFKPGKVCAALQRPTRGGLHMRFELSTRRLFIGVRAFRSYCRTANQASPLWMMRELRQLGIMATDLRKVSLGAGTDIETGRQSCLEIDMAHPLMSGVAREVVPDHPAAAKLGIVIEKNG